MCVCVCVCVREGEREIKCKTKNGFSNILKIWDSDYVCHHQTYANTS